MLPGPCQAGSWHLRKSTMSLPSGNALPLPREWLHGKSLEQQARAMGVGAGASAPARSAQMRGKSVGSVMTLKQESSCEM